MKKKTQPKFALARIKKIIQNNEEIGKISHSIPFLVSKSLELFLNDFITKIIDTANDIDTTKLTGSVIKKTVEKDEKLKFLTPVLKDIIIDDEGEKQNKKSKQNKKIKTEKKVIDLEEEEENESNIIEKIKKKIKKERKPRKVKRKLLSDEEF